MLDPLEGLVILDEIQRMPGLFALLRVLADRLERDTKFLILGSAAPELVKGAAESLAGRVAFHDLHGFDLGETYDMRRLQLRGGFPPAYLASSELRSLQWREQFIRTYLERDLPQLGIQIPATAMRRFWTMLAHYHGQIWNGSELARSFATSDPTVRKYLDILTHTFMAFTLQPWHENLKKRQVKSPKVYLGDTGILHSLLNIETFDQLLSHPKVGASWEGFAIRQILNEKQTRDAYFWATHGGAELDLLLFEGGKRIGYEFKFSESPKTTKSMHSAIADLSLDHLYVIHPGEHSFPLTENITACPLERVL